METYRDHARKFFQTMITIFIYVIILCDHASMLKGV